MIGRLLIAPFREHHRDPLAMTGHGFRLLFPSILTSPQLREIYPMGLVRGLIHITLLGAFFWRLLSVILRKNRVLGSVGIGFSLWAAALGGSQVPANRPGRSGTYAGMD